MPILEALTVLEAWAWGRGGGINYKTSLKTTSSKHILNYLRAYNELF